MPKKLNKINYIMEHLQNSVEYDLESYRKIVDEINTIKLNNFTDSKLKEMSQNLKRRSLNGAAADQLLVEAYALVREVSRRVLGMHPFNVQVIAGTALHKGKLVEMQTGEGKTLAAVMPAYLNALTGKGVHIHTFNDYLAQRDAEWMGPIYRFLRLTIGHVKEGMTTVERQNAYAADITYVTAKEAGFDYLRDFLCVEKERLIHKPFHYAIVDEADSILIDEARIPLVIAGSIPQKEDNFLDLLNVIRGLMGGRDYEIDQYGRNIYLTDAGLSRVEEILECGNLYDPKNLELLAKINCVLHAEILIERDKDYIVRNGKIELIDGFTGRIAEKRHWPDNLHAAVEAKEGLSSPSKGTIMGSIALQHFLRLYPRIAGMTGTARSAAKEFKEFYNMEVLVIPTNKPCIRKDYRDRVFAHKEAKRKAIISEIKRVHETGQPILIGTGSIEESEQLADDLKKAGVTCQVLNAKNDEMEAAIIAGAGQLGAVTVSTNMAGRGVDIKLGGEKEQEKKLVAALGGLYVIGTSCHESSRIGDQLRGRAGRQGDPGETRFFISLEDDLMKKHDMAKLISHKHYPQKQGEFVEDPAVICQIAKGQRYVEGYYSDIRRQLWKYSFIIEQQRRIVHSRRQDILTDKLPLQLLSTKAPERYFSLLHDVGEDVLQKVEKQITLYHINKCWAEYLDHMAYIRESIHLVVLGKQDPLDEFHRIAIEAFDVMLARIDTEIIKTFYAVEVHGDGIDIDKEGLKGPSSTWTYLINDSPDQFSNLPFLVKATLTTMGKPLFTIRSLYRRIFQKKQRMKK